MPVFWGQIGIRCLFNPPVFSSMPSNQRRPGTNLLLNNLNVLLLALREAHTPRGAVGHLSKSVLERTYRVWVCAGWFGESSRKWDFALAWMLSGSMGHSMIGCVQISYLEGGRNEARLKL